MGWLTPRRVLAARVVAVCADFLQLGLMPLFFQGFLSSANDILDLAVAAVMIALVGWHWAFLPSFVAEMVPFFNLVPTWTAAVFLATRHQGEFPKAATRYPPPHAPGSTPPQAAMPAEAAKVRVSRPRPEPPGSVTR
jgi:hypothetical protein